MSPKNNKPHNFYEDIVAKDIYENPGFKKHNMTIPFRALILGSSGSGKTSVFLDLLKRFRDTFDTLILCGPEGITEEPLYEHLLSKIPKGNVIICEGIDNIIRPETIKREMGQVLICFDDLCLEPEAKQKIISEYYIRGRKIAKGVSCCYLSQSYFKVPRVVRLQSNYIFLKKLGSTRDLRQIIKENSLNVDEKKLIKAYKDIVNQDFLNFMLIDNGAPDDRRFRKNYLEYITIE